MCVSICGCVLMFVFSQLFILTLRVIQRHVSICPTFIEDNEAVILRQLHWIGTGPQTAAQGDTHTHIYLSVQCFKRSPWPLLSICQI